MSDYLSQGTFDILWDQLVEFTEDDTNNKFQNENAHYVEVTAEQFEEMYGVGVNELLNSTEFETTNNEQIALLPADMTIENNEITNNEQNTMLPADMTIENNETNNDETEKTDMFIAVPIYKYEQMDVEQELDENELNKSNDLNQQANNTNGTSNFVTMSNDDVINFIESLENKNTLKKTMLDVKKFHKFLKTKGESREMHNIPADFLDGYVANYILSVRKTDGGEYEPSTIRNIVSSLDRHLKKMKYPKQIMQEKNTNEFQLSRDALKAKQKSLKRMGKGNKPNASSSITDQEIDLLYEKGVLGAKSPKALLNVVWFNNCIHFGIRGTTECHQLRWGDISLHTDSDGVEYLAYNERQTKTRTGEDLSDIRKTVPKLWSTPYDPERCPVENYKMYASKRPPTLCGSDHPFYIAPRTTPLSMNNDTNPTIGCSTSPMRQASECPNQINVASTYIAVSPTHNQNLLVSQCNPTHLSTVTLNTASTHQLQSLFTGSTVHIGNFNVNIH